MDFPSGDLAPTSTERPASWKSVKTRASGYYVVITLSGKKATPPLNPPKNISPLRLLKQASQPVRSLPGSPSAVEEFGNLFATGSTLDKPRLELIQSMPDRSSRMQLKLLVGKPSFS